MLVLDKRPETVMDSMNGMSVSAVNRHAGFRASHWMRFSFGCRGKHDTYLTLSAGEEIEIVPWAQAVLPRTMDARTCRMVFMHLFPLLLGAQS